MVHSADSSDLTLSPGSKASLLPRNRHTLSQSDRVQSFASISTESPYTAGAGSRLAAISHRFHLSPDPRDWGSSLYSDCKEPDDDLHNPSVRDHNSWGPDRGLANIGCLLIMAVGLITLFAGYPIITYFTRTSLSNQGGFNLGGINASGQIPKIPGNLGLIDTDTPGNVFTKPSWNGGPDMELVFSDEFNTPGRTFWPGDDPYWEAVDLHYWQTNNLEWYDPAAITTQDGYLVITLSQKETHSLNYQGGMMSTWNKFCFTGGYIEASVSLPGVNNVVGLWPAIWTLGNLGRAGYGASLEGMWPYTYDACDIGTVPNQTVNGLPIAATEGGDSGQNGILSFLPGQRLSRCTCKGESHPGPMHSDGTFVGRAAPEIDMFEAQITGEPLTGQVSQSAQWGPFNAGYIWKNTSDNEIIPNPSITVLNTYIGGVEQQATSAVTNTNQGCYEGETGCFSVYGFEYLPGFDKAYITWIANNEVSWTLNVAGMGPDPAVGISARPIPQEPMYIIMNLGMSTNFGPVDLEHLPFPVHMRVDYIRVYQPSNARNIGCDPKAFPTADYINTYSEAYTNPNLTTWKGDFNQPFPKNSFLGQC
ncbi:glycoside hydrolase family 16 protein [Suillus clintonianus]|uniref:glycoside hydrolase family 16 protein n=1 Tax=Suillus clintonianus TaxID=1904413 RepID=UPI001B87F2CE|nr:glycoside hydrolase family 16 protein [Suillus clintonianus]KAG2156292.1 glycoside hydrolase family 16 protein [Suillus clintonianus]